MYQLAIAGSTAHSVFPYIRDKIEGLSKLNASARNVVRMLQDRCQEHEVFQELLTDTPKEEVIGGFVGLYENTDLERDRTEWYKPKGESTGELASISSAHTDRDAPEENTGGTVLKVELSLKLLRKEMTKRAEHAHLLLNNHLVSPEPGPRVFLCLLGVPSNLSALALLAEAGVSLSVPNAGTLAQKMKDKFNFDVESLCLVESPSATSTVASSEKARILRVVNPVTQQHVVILGFESASAARVFSARWHGSLLPPELNGLKDSMVASTALYVATLESIAWIQVPSWNEAAEVDTKSNSNFACTWHESRRLAKRIIISINKTLMIYSAMSHELFATLPKADEAIPSCPRCLEKLDTNIYGGCSLVPSSALALPSSLSHTSFVYAALTFEKIPESRLSGILHEEESGNGMIIVKPSGCHVCWVRRNLGVPIINGIEDKIENAKRETENDRKLLKKVPINSQLTLSAGKCDDCAELDTPIEIRDDVLEYNELFEENRSHHASKITKLKSLRWICLTCAHIACPRYCQSHALRHGLLCRHQHAMDTSNGIIWSYKKDGYCHRIESAPLAVATAAAATAAAATAALDAWPSNTNDNGNPNTYIQAQESKLSNHETLGGKDEEEEEEIKVRIGDERKRANNNELTRHSTEDELLASVHPTFKGDYLSPENQFNGLLATKLKSINSHYAELLERQLEEQKKRFEDSVSKLAQETLEERNSQKKELDDARRRLEVLTEATLEIQREAREANQRVFMLHSEMGPLRASSQLLRGYMTGKFLEGHQSRVDEAKSVLTNLGISADELPSVVKTGIDIQKVGNNSVTRMLPPTEKKDSRAEPKNFASMSSKLRKEIEGKDRKIDALKKLVMEEMARLDKINRISHAQEQGQDNDFKTDSTSVTSAHAPMSPKSNTYSRSMRSFTAEDALDTADALRQLLELEDSEFNTLSSKRGKGTSSTQKSSKRNSRK